MSGHLVKKRRFEKSVKFAEGKIQDIALRVYKALKAIGEYDWIEEESWKNEAPELTKEEMEREAVKEIEETLRRWLSEMVKPQEEGRMSSIASGKFELEVGPIDGVAVHVIVFPLPRDFRKAAERMGLK